MVSFYMLNYTMYIDRNKFDVEFSMQIFVLRSDPQP